VKGWWTAEGFLLWGKEKKRKEVERDGLHAGLKEKRAGFGKGKRQRERFEGLMWFLRL
jgi:hypothetical protein